MWLDVLKRHYIFPLEHEQRSQYAQALSQVIIDGWWFPNTIIKGLYKEFVSRIIHWRSFQKRTLVIEHIMKEMWMEFSIPVVVEQDLLNGSRGNNTCIVNGNGTHTTEYNLICNPPSPVIIPPVHNGTSHTNPNGVDTVLQHDDNDSKVAVETPHHIEATRIINQSSKDFFHTATQLISQSPSDERLLQIIANILHHQCGNIRSIDTTSNKRIHIPIGSELFGISIQELINCLVDICIPNKHQHRILRVERVKTMLSLQYEAKKWYRNDDIKPIELDLEGVQWHIKAWVFDLEDVLLGFVSAYKKYIQQLVFTWFDKLDQSMFVNILGKFHTKINLLQITDLVQKEHPRLQEHEITDLILSYFVVKTGKSITYYDTLTNGQSGYVLLGLREAVNTISRVKTNRVYFSDQQSLSAVI